MKKSTQPATTRRRILRGLGAGAFGAASIGLVSGGSSDDTVWIPTVKYGNSIIRRKKVPRAWREQTLHTREALNSFKNKYLDEPGIAGIGARRWEENQFGDYTGLRIGVEVDSDRFSGSLPEKYKNIPVEQRKARTSVPLCSNLCDFDPIPGGVTIEAEEGLPGGTTGYKVENGDGEPRMLTANHIWGPCDSNGSETAFQNSDEIGQVAGTHESMDYATIEPNSGESFKDTVQQPSTEYKISGYKTESGVEDELCCDSCDTTIRKMGVTTDVTYGQVDECHYSDGESCVDFSGEGVRCTNNVAQGDSGGPLYEKIRWNGTSYAVIIGHLSSAESAINSTSCTSCIAEGDTRTIFDFVEAMTFYEIKNNSSITLS